MQRMPDQQHLLHASSDRDHHQAVAGFRESRRCAASRAPAEHESGECAQRQAPDRLAAAATRREDRIRHCPATNPEPAWTGDLQAAIAEIDDPCGLRQGKARDRLFMRLAGHARGRALGRAA